MSISRRTFLKAALAMGASLALGGVARSSSVRWKERRDLFPHGVASGDPDPNSRTPLTQFYALQLVQDQLRARQRARRPLYVLEAQRSRPTHPSDIGRQPLDLRRELIGIHII